MSDDIPFDRSFDLAPEQVEEVRRAVRRPGLTGNRRAVWLGATDVRSEGDQVMAWSTPVVSPPDGAMSDDMASVEKLLGRREQVYFPGHGGTVKDARQFVGHYIRHR